MIEKYFWYTDFLLYPRSERSGGEIQYLKYFSMWVMINISITAQNQWKWSCDCIDNRPNFNIFDLFQNLSGYPVNKGDTPGT